MILAAGGNQMLPKGVPGVEKGIPCNDVLRGKVTLRDAHVAVIGGGMSGLETAKVSVHDA